MSVLENPISPRLQISADGSEHPFSRFFGQFRCASQFKLLFNSGLMRLDCLHTQVQLARQTRRAEAAPDHARLSTIQVLTRMSSFSFFPTRPLARTSPRTLWRPRSLS